MGMLSRGKHRATRSGRRRTAAMSATVSAGVALAGAAVIGVAPTLSVSPALTASLHYLRGTNIGGVTTEQQYQDFITQMVAGTGVTPPDSPYVIVPYNAGFRPFSHGGFGDLTYNDSVQQGADLLDEQGLSAGDIIFGYSQGAVAASVYKATHTGNTYILVENPSRPNGGILQRFKGLTIPFIDVTFGGATPNNGDPTYDISRQYDGWSDFPAYLWNPIAVANAVMGILLIHSSAQTELTAEDLEAAEASGDPDYYQYDADSNTHYYVIKTYPIPLLMPLDWLLSDPVMAALDAPLRRFIETAYDRTDYSVPTTAKFFKPWTSTTAVDTEVPDVQRAAAPSADDAEVDGSPVGDSDGAETSDGGPADTESTDPAQTDVGDSTADLSDDAAPADDAEAADDLAGDDEVVDDAVDGATDQGDEQEDAGDTPDPAADEAGDETGGTEATGAAA